MSELLIRGMEMPVAGQVIEVASGINGDVFVRLSPGSDEWYPVESIPPHGDLIDRNELKENLYVYNSLSGKYFIDINQIDYTKAIIKSSGGDGE